MGRPFICYEDVDDEPCTSGALQTSEAWMAAAYKALDGRELVLGREAVTAALAFIFSARREAFTPNCHPAPEDGLELSDSKVGGVPYLHPSESWPTNGDTPLCHLWQQRISELPTAVQQALGHSRGLLQVFVAEALDDEGGDWHLVRVLPQEQLVPRGRGEVVPPPEVALLDEQRVVSYSRTYDFPVLEDLLCELPVGLDPDTTAAVAQALQDADLYRTVTGDKLLGWPNWCQGPEWCCTDNGQRFAHVVQIEGSTTNFHVGDGGTLVLQRHPERRDCWAASWACC